MVGHPRGNRMEKGMRWLGVTGATEWKRGGDGGHPRGIRIEDGMRWLVILGATE